MKTITINGHSIALAVECNQKIYHVVNVPEINKTLLFITEHHSYIAKDDDGIVEYRTIEEMKKGIYERYERRRKENTLFRRIKQHIG